MKDQKPQDWVPKQPNHTPTPKASRRDNKVRGFGLLRKKRSTLDPNKRVSK